MKLGQLRLAGHQARAIMKRACTINQCSEFQSGTLLQTLGYSLPLSQPSVPLESESDQSGRIFMKRFLMPISVLSVLFYTIVRDNSIPPLYVTRGGIRC